MSGKESYEQSGLVQRFVIRFGRALLAAIIILAIILIAKMALNGPRSLTNLEFVHELKFAVIGFVAIGFVVAIFQVLGESTRKRPK
jgi:hypothetical protein